ncbi:MAG TPA: hypothetical protein VK573_06510 [Gemmatimonadales bacterium]|nr:hypothetical protein [Gemmatimonadales bacterium]
MRCILAFAALIVALPLAAQVRDQPDRTIDAAERRAVIDGVIDHLKQAYVFPDTAVAMERAVRARQRRGEYEASPAREPSRIRSRLTFRPSVATATYACATASSPSPWARTRTAPVPKSAPAHGHSVVR